ncbi:fungal-specific transcription factor domain-containing protein [Lipomyces starkeyi]
MSRPGIDVSARKDRRAPMACEFCRRRKMKCNNERPTCQNCRDNERECIYAELAKRPRPSHARISRLEEENRRLQESLSSLREQLKRDQTNHNDTSITTSAELQSAAPTIHVDNNIIFQPCRRPSPSVERAHRSAQTSRSNQSPVAKRVFAPDKESCYHGPTSAVYDEHPTDLGPRRNVSTTPKVSQIWVKRQLVAESAKQRQLETVNFISRKLDFDGVEPELGMHLLSIHWSRQQSTGPVVYRTAFMRDMACAGPYFSKLLLNAIYFSSSKFTPRIEVRRDPDNPLTAGWSYRQRVVDLLSKCFDKSNVTTIQALLIMSTALFSWCDEKSTSWLYAGMAYNMIIDLGIHVDATTLKRRLCEEEMEIRRRLYWAAYVTDKIQSLYQGRPACLRETGTNLPMNILDNYEELELFAPLSYTETQSHPSSPGYMTTSFIEACKLSIILDRILLSLYSENSGSRSPDELFHDSRSVHAELENWRKDLPQHVDIFHLELINIIPLPNMLALFAMFNVMMILLHRPFVSDGHLQSTSPSVASEAFSICSVAASEIDHILRTYDRYFCLRSTPYIISYATYVSATIHVRIAAQRTTGSEAHKSLRRCVDVLNIHQTVCWSARRAKRVVDILIAHMGVVLDTEALDGSSNRILPDIDIIAIMRTFAAEQQSGDHQSSQLQQQCPDIDQLDLAVPDGSTLQTMDLDANVSNANILSGENMNHTGDHSYFLYDPIFGFNGSTFDDFDLHPLTRDS